jgi:hypothetical protein
MARKKTRPKIAIIIFASLLLLLAAGAVIYIRMLPPTDTAKAAARKVSLMLRTHSRKADILVTEVSFDENEKKLRTAVRFTEYNAVGKPMESRVFYFNGNVVQVQSLMIKLNNLDMENADYFRNKNAYLFWKAFLPNGRETKQIELTNINTVPEAYKTKTLSETDEEKIWKALWDYALDSKNANNIVVKNVKIDAPGVVFIPGTVYTVKIRQDGSLKVETFPYR